MIENDSLEKTIFSISSPYSTEIMQIHKQLFLKEKSKILSIIQNGNTLGKIHSHLLDEEFEMTLSLFEENKFLLPDEFDPRFVEIIIKYIYFKEIINIPLCDVFKLFKFSFFLRIEDLSKKILEFLKMNLYDIKKVLFIRENIYELLYFFKEKAWNFMKPIIENSSIFLIQNNHFKEFIDHFNSNYFESFKDFIENEFNFYLVILKKCSCENEKIIKFILVFKNYLINFLKQTNQNFNEEIYFKKVITAKFDFNLLNSKEIQILFKKNANNNLKNENKELTIESLRDIIES